MFPCPRARCISDPPVSSSRPLSLFFLSFSDALCQPRIAHMPLFLSLLHPPSFHSRCARLAPSPLGWVVFWEGDDVAGSTLSWGDPTIPFVETKRPRTVVACTWRRCDGGRRMHVREHGREEETCRQRRGWTKEQALLSKTCGWIGLDTDVSGEH